MLVTVSHKVFIGRFHGKIKVANNDNIVSIRKDKEDEKVGSHDRIF